MISATYADLVEFNLLKQRLLDLTKSFITPASISNPSKNSINISNPLGNSSYIFASASKERVYFDIGLSNISRVISPSLSPEFLLGTLKFSNKNPTETLWKEIKVIPPGWCAFIRFEDDAFHVTYAPAALSTIHGKTDPAEILIDEISRILPGFDRVILRFSGGVDSTAILLALREISSVPVSAYTWVCDGSSAPQDLDIAATLCKNLGVEHHLFKIDPSCLYTPIPPEAVAPDASTAMASFNVMDQFYAGVRLRYGSEKILAVHGHGGDHVFYDPPHPLSILERKKLFGRGGFFKILADYCSATGVNFWKPISEIFRIDASQANKSETARDRHLKMISSACFENGYSPLMPEGIVNFAPFTTPQMISAALKLSTWEFFEDGETRRPLKNSLRRRFSDCPTLRRDKGHLTAAFQRALALRESQLKKRVLSGSYVQHGLLSAEWLNDQWKRCQAGVGGINPFLFSAICVLLAEDAIEKI
ncbi:hypothetical protein D9M72_344810 [compost metagenome]